MANYVLPVFNLACRWARFGLWPVIAGSAMGNLAWGRRVNVGCVGGPPPTTVLYHTMTLLLPALTDIRGDYTAADSDLVEVPSFSGRFYTVLAVDDIGKGFSNEHRAAQLLMQLPITWPLP